MLSIELHLTSFLKTGIVKAHNYSHYNFIEYSHRLANEDMCVVEHFSVTNLTFLLWYIHVVWEAFVISLAVSFKNTLHSKLFNVLPVSFFCSPDGVVYSCEG